MKPTCDYCGDKDVRIVIKGEDDVEMICEQWMEACADEECRCALIGFSWRAGRKVGYDDAVRQIKLATKELKRGRPGA